MKLNKDKLKKVFSLDNIVDAAVDLFLVLFDVITSPILIVMRIIRWTIGTYVLDGLKNKIKKIIRWVRNKPRWIQLLVVTALLVASAYILVLIWIFGQAWGEFVVEEF